MSIRWDEAEIAAGMNTLANLTPVERESRLGRLSANVNQFSFERSRDRWQAALRAAARAYERGS